MYAILLAAFLSIFLRTKASDLRLSMSTMCVTWCKLMRLVFKLVRIVLN